MSMSFLEEFLWSDSKYTDLTLPLNKWKDQLTLEEILQIEETCSEAMKLYGYRKFNNSSKHHPSFHSFAANLVLWPKFPIVKCKIDALNYKFLC